MKLCFASRNANKILEIKAKLGNQFEIVSLDDIGCFEELPETHETIPENSQEKAEFVWNNFSINCFADDSGLEVEALNGEPGVHSAYYSGSRDFDKNIALLLKKLDGQTNRKASFVTVISLIIDGKLMQFEGRVEGEIMYEIRGDGGFGYDPVFLPSGYEKTFAEMTLIEKNEISHRSRAFQKLIQYLNI